MVGESKKNQLDDVVLVWKRIPKEAVVVCSPLGKVEIAVGTQYRLFDDMKPVTVEILSKRETPKIARVMGNLVDILKVPPSAMVLKHLVMIIMSWFKGKNPTSDYAAAHDYFKAAFPDVVDELDRRVYAQACHQYLRDALAYTPTGTENNLTVLNVSLNNARKYLPPTFEEWRARCAKAEKRVRNRLRIVFYRCWSERVWSFPLIAYCAWPER